MLDTATTIFVNILVGVAAAIAGVLLGTRMERRRSEAERLYRTKLDAYMDVASEISNIGATVMHVAQVLMHYFRDEKKALEAPWFMMGGFHFGVPPAWRYELHKEIERVIDIEDDKEKIKHMRLVAMRYAIEGISQVRAAAVTISRKIKLLEFVGMPEPVGRRIEKVTEILFDETDSYWTAFQEGEYLLQQSEEELEKWSDKLDKAVDGMELVMIFDLRMTR